MQHEHSALMTVAQKCLLAARCQPIVEYIITRTNRIIHDEVYFVGRHPFSLFVLRSARSRRFTPRRCATSSSFLSADSGLSEIQSWSILSRAQVHYHPSRLGWARSRITPLQQTFSPRTMHPMPSPLPPRLYHPSLFLSFTLVLHPLQRDRESIVGCGSENGMGDRPVGRSNGRSQKIPEVVIRTDCSKFMSRFTRDFAVDFGTRQT